MKPTIGRIVLYRNTLGEDVPAIITHVSACKRSVDLTIFQRKYIEHDIDVPLDPDDTGHAPTPGTYRWPERS